MGSIRNTILKSLSNHTQDRGVHDACLRLMDQFEDEDEVLADSNGIGIRALVTLAENYDVVRKLYTDKDFKRTMSEPHRTLYRNTIKLGDELREEISTIIDSSTAVHEDDLIESLADFIKDFDLSEGAMSSPSDEMKRKLKSHPRYVLCGINIFSYPDMAEGMLCVPRKEVYKSDAERKMIAKVIRSTKNWR